MKKESSFFVSGLIIGLIIATGIFSLFVRSMEGRSEKTVLKLGHCLDTNHPVHKGMVFMKERLEELSGGTATIDIYPSSVLGSEVECIAQLRSGDLAMTKTSAASLENFVPELKVFGLPYLFRSEEHFWTVLKSELGGELLKKGNDKGVQGLCYYDSGSRNFYTKDKPVKTPEDLKNLKIRVMNSEMAMKMVSSLGASPTPIAWGELYTALAQGTVDGAENNPPSFTTNKHYEVCKHFSKDAHTRIPDVLLMSTKIWRSLDSRLQSWLMKAAKESREYQRELWKEETKRSLEFAEENGVTIHEVDQSLFAEKVQPMYEAIENEEIIKLVKKIREIKP
ncbi:C4-dicarboxylate-binding periplasmic protein precursor [Sedimentisphaera cyanobacteriorum]|uniref:C4-dicarboxylate-binding periplasmic protein n=1 Tax=Sedimentisphaera cyanobacteriorum TaxID=1940790 RepID=A0A1Q2HNI7_9BACT|nr:TRAP transporter substrate-binding protein [Sedimentisphaera cyanobacteriorum]AQQ08773.1 C4-dicarboxylate-binding periplasmic protein precursor [Sedimentisphaera cyanobacteriorum]